MAIVNLLPDGDISNSPAWTLSTGSDVFALLDDDDTGNPTSDGSQITATATGKKCIVGFDDFDDTDVDSIESVQGVIKANVYERGKTYSLGMTIRNLTPAPAWNEELTPSTNSSGSWVTFLFTTQTERHQIIGGAWNNVALDNIRMEINANALSGGTLRVTYAYFKVTYTPVAVSADNATFFGANF